MAACTHVVLHFLHMQVIFLLIHEMTYAVYTGWIRTLG